MNNLSSYCGLVDANIRASDKDSPVCGQILGIASFRTGIFSFSDWKNSRCHFLKSEILLFY